MKTMNEIAKELGVTLSAANTVLERGKFEQEHISTVYFYEESLNGMGDVYPFGDGEGGCEIIIEMTDGDRQLFGFKAYEKYFYLRERSDGFITGEPITEQHYKNFINAVEKEESNK
jgi:hypothetical protein